MANATDVVQKLFTTFQREQTLESVLPLFDPDVEWADEVVTKTTLHGHKGFADAMANLDREGYRSEAAPEGFVDLGDGAVLAHGATRLIRGDSYTDLPAFWAFEIREGKIVRGGTATRRADALAAIGREP